MSDRIQSDATISGKASQYQPILPQDKRRFYIGIDVGSTSSDITVLDSAGKSVLCDYRRTKGKPVETVRLQLDRIFRQINPLNITLAVATGSAGRFLAKLLDIPFINEVPAQAAAICHLYPQLQQATIIEMGGQDSKLIFLSAEQGRARVRDFTLNTVCAAGTGSFLDQQAQRLGVNIEGEFGRMALQSKAVPRMAGRCSVFAKSDMIHLQQQATPSCDIIAGLCLALARNLKGDLGCGREFVKPIIFTGGVAANIGVVRALEKVFELPQDELVVPKEHFFTGAIGAVLIAKERTGSNGQIHLEKIDSYLTQRGSALEGAPRRGVLGRPSLPYPDSHVYEHLLSSATESIEAYLGVDVGSISTKAAVVDNQNRLLAKHYMMTTGNPLEAVRQTLDIIGKKVGGKVNICGAATTGSGRYLIGDFIGADVVINEITAQAKGAAIVDPMVDTIFEIGGQDSKYISLENGVVVDFTMNHACAAGTGSFLEEQAQRLDISIDRQFAEQAFSCREPVKLGERCTVFMESDLLCYQQQGAKTNELVAGLSYSIVENYLNRVVGRRKVGEHICFQGGTAFNKAVWAAFETVVGKPVMVPDHHEVTGAIGAAAIAAGHIKKSEAAKSSFKGFENVCSIQYQVESFTCEHCPNHCEIKKVQLPDTEPLYYGSRCDRYNLKKKTAKAKGLDAFEYRKQMLFECAGLNDKPSKKQYTKVSIGIPLALTNWQLLPLFSQFFKAMGFDCIISGKTDKRIIRMGVESVNAQPCFPVKAAYGHIAELIEKKVDYIFLPSIVSMTESFPQNKSNQLCPYVQSLVYQAQTAFGKKLGDTKILTTPIRMGDGQKLLQKSFIALGRTLGVSASSARKALEKGFAAQQKFESALLDKGKEILDQLGPEQKLFVLISRPYNGCDEGLNLQLSKKFDELGVRVIPIDMLALDDTPLTDPLLHEQAYWSYGQKILRAAEIIKRDPRLFAIYLSNFSCGPDSFLLTFFKDIMAQKPCLLLELDEHSADAGVITRLEAFLDSLKHYHSLEKKPQAKKLAIPEGISRERTLYIPYMSDCAYGVVACFKAHGQPAEVMPLADEAALLQGRQFTSGKECLPCAITSGDMLKVIRAKGFDPAKAAFFMPASSGPCRFGMYSCLHRLILKYAGAEDVPVIAPNQDSGFYREFTKGVGSSMGKFMKDIWISVSGIDLLRKLILRIRPFAADSRQAQRVYDQSIRRWTQAVEGRFSFSQMRRLMESIAGDFAAVKLNGSTRKPMIGIVGEIYVRSHPFANSNIIARLEELGAVCDLASLAEWMYYTNFTRSLSARRKGNYRDWFTNVFQDYFQRRIEKALAEPLEKMLRASGLYNQLSLSEGPLDYIIELAKPYIHHSFEGEAILSVGKMIEYHHQGFGGVVNAMPFSCMPSTIVNTQTRRISADCADMPILNLSFDGQEDSTLTTRLEAFVEQVRQRQPHAAAQVVHA
ncbi:MAG: acyl-CoA dehydratase activase [Phycisphaerae bacterium]|nr:acyl-CoA dehydratase activase [Phycisphaerae bacterium]MDD5380555.1 acyl-CoA dehydratase activase [Phycisphaerae bacterium]